MIVVRGSLALIIGVAITLLAVALGSTVGLYAGTVVSGLRPTTYAYGVVAMALAALTAVAVWRAAASARLRT